MEHNFQRENISSYSISEVADLIKRTPNIIPNVQRRFVWNPAQVENIWDSILRGYPVGAFVFNKNNMDLLDGQQRATSICMGFGDVVNLDKRAQKFKLFIDLEKPKNTDKRMFIFRIITKSHPWGYQKTDNTKTLSANRIRDALSDYNVENFLVEPIDCFWPYDATMPLPVEIFLNSENLQDCEKKIDEWLCGHKKLKERLVLLQSDNLYSIKELFERFYTTKNKQLIPALYLNVETIAKEARTATYEKEEDTDDVENLFIRLNSGGTPLVGEELNYSILKSKLDKDAQQKIENACNGVMKPARLITISYRLFQVQKKIDDSSDALSMRIRPKQFQSSIAKNADEFKNFLNETIINAIEQMKSVLTYSAKTCPFGMPSFIVSNIADRAPEVMFILLYRLIHCRDFNKIMQNEDLHKRVIGAIFLLLWFGKGSNGRNHSKMLNQLWNKDKSLHNLSSSEFWSSKIYGVFFDTKQNINNDVMVKIPTLRALNRYLSEGDDIFEKLSEDNLTDSAYADFFLKTIDNLDLLLYMQRDALDTWFGKYNQLILEDTNVPFDIDHISPQKYVHRCKHINSTLKFWYYTIGNLRAWPYSSNRSDGDVAPAEKLSVHNEKRLEILCKSVNLKIDDYANDDNIFFKWSKCDSSWGKLNNNKSLHDENAVQTLECIIRRMRAIYKDLYGSLMLDDLIKV